MVTASAGNHAQGLALAAKVLGVKATIVMPKTTPEIKIEGVRSRGGIVGVYVNVAFLFDQLERISQCLRE